MKKKISKKVTKKTVKKEPNKKAVITKFTKNLVEIANQKKPGIMMLALKEKNGILFSSISCDMTVGDVDCVISQLIEIAHPEMKEIADMLKGFKG